MLKLLCSILIAFIAINIAYANSTLQVEKTNLNFRVHQLGENNQIYEFDIAPDGEYIIYDTSGKNDQIKFLRNAATQAMFYGIDGDDEDLYVDSLGIDFFNGQSVVIVEYFNNTSRDMQNSLGGAGLIETIQFAQSSPITIQSIKERLKHNNVQWQQHIPKQEEAKGTVIVPTPKTNNFPSGSITCDDYAKMTLWAHQIQQSLSPLLLDNPKVLTLSLMLEINKQGNILRIRKTSWADNEAYEAELLKKIMQSYKYSSPPNGETVLLQINQKSMYKAKKQLSYTCLNYQPKKINKSSLGKNTIQQSKSLEKYTELVVQKVKNNWKPLTHGPSLKEGEYLFTINRKGQLLSSKILYSSGYTKADQLALNAIKASNPFPPIPSTYSRNIIDIQMRFTYSTSKKTAQDLLIPPEWIKVTDTSDPFFPPPFIEYRHRDDLDTTPIKRILVEHRQITEMYTERGRQFYRTLIQTDVDCKSGKTIDHWTKIYDSGTNTVKHIQSHSEWKTVYPEYFKLRYGNGVCKNYK